MRNAARERSLRVGTNISNFFTTIACGRSCHDQAVKSCGAAMDEAAPQAPEPAVVSMAFCFVIVITLAWKALKKTLQSRA